MIVDWDVHHGQATQQMFYDDKRFVLLVFVDNIVTVNTFQSFIFLNSSI